MASDSASGGRTTIGALGDLALFAAATALAAMLLHYSAVLPNARRAERLERRGYALERDVAALAADVERLRGEVVALQSDPYSIERTLKLKLARLRPSEGAE